MDAKDRQAWTMAVRNAIASGEVIPTPDEYLSQRQQQQAQALNQQKLWDQVNASRQSGR